MTKHEMNLISKLIHTIISESLENGLGVCDYLSTDIMMMVNTDLEALRKKEFPLPMSGIVKEVYLNL